MPFKKTYAHRQARIDESEENECESEREKTGEEGKEANIEKFSIL